MSNIEWFKLEDVEDLSVKHRVKLTQEYVNPGMAKLFGILGFDRVRAVSAEGMYIVLDDGRHILDMTAGNCVLGLGHNHPRILKARGKVANEKRLEICKSFLSPYVAALSSNMAALLPKDLQYSFFCGSGAESVEGALKLAQKHHGKDRCGIVYTDHSFHGKTHAAMSVSSMEEHRHHFQLLPQCYQVTYGDDKSLEALFRSRSNIETGKPDLCAFIVEAIHGTRLIFPPKGYLKRVRELCDIYDVLLIIDEIYTGFGRTGHWFAFESEEIVPDIVCYSKTFGGGKATIAGYTARKDVFLKAYGKAHDSMIHTSTFSGMTEECATAIEALNIIKDDHLVERARELGVYLEEQLIGLKKRYPNGIADVRGCGLLWGVELRPPLSQLNQMIGKILPNHSLPLPELIGAIVLSEMFHEHNVLAYLGFTRRNLVVFSPALIAGKSDLDHAINALDVVLSKGWMSLVHSFLARQVHL